MDKATKKWLLMAGGAGALLLREVVRHRRAFELRGKIVLITGGSRGLGLVLARAFAREGAHIALCARDGSELDRARADLLRSGADVYTVVCDVTDLQAVETMVQQVSYHFGHIDVLVNNAGIIEVGPLEEMQITDFEEAMKTHFWATVYTSLAVLPMMRERRRGRIINISSVGGKISVPHLLPYSASKFAQVGFSEGLRAEAIKDNIFVTTVCPGLMRTGSHLQAQFKGQNKKEFAAFSLLGSLPIFSISAESAARQILTACRNGDPEIILSLPAQAGALFHGLFPGLTANLFGLAERLLPQPGGIGKRKTSGAETLHSISPSLLAALNAGAAKQNNET